MVSIGTSSISNGDVTVLTSDIENNSKLGQPESCFLQPIHSRCDPLKDKVLYPKDHGSTNKRHLENSNPGSDLCRPS